MVGYNRMTNHIGSFLLDHRLLAQFLHLPEGTEILGVLDHDRYTCRVLVTHPDIPNGSVIELKPVFHTIYHEPQEFEQIAETELESWGIEKPE